MNKENFFLEVFQVDFFLSLDGIAGSLKMHGSSHLVFFLFLLWIPFLNSLDIFSQEVIRSDPPQESLSLSVFDLCHVLVELLEKHRVLLDFFDLVRDFIPHL